MGETRPPRDWRTEVVPLPALTEALTTIEGEGWTVFGVHYLGMAQVQGPVLSPQAGVMPTFVVVAMREAEATVPA